MIPKFFGQYLLEKGLITADQLLKAINYQRNMISKIGEIGIRINYLNENQVAHINSYQRKVDIKFGELAVAMNYLTDEQLTEILTIQKNNHIYLGEAIVILGYVSSEIMEQELKLFHQEQTELVGLENLIPNNHRARVQLLPVVDITVKMMRRIGDLLAKIGDIQESSSIDNLYLTTFVEFSSIKGFKYFLNLPEKVAFTICQQLYQRLDMDITNEILKDAVGEFTNIICGNIRAELLEVGKLINITIPVTILRSEVETFKFNDGESVISFPSMTTEGNFEVGIVDQGKVK
ncbi:MAG: chemotaxis protein CheX [Bacteroidales bacterium]|nr:chemotaxis protein CheX [Bacteroidales bacterium]